MKKEALIIFGIFILIWLNGRVSAAPIAVINASRTSCVAPCAVFFDATETTSITTNRPFHELDYTWDFGDENSGNWVTNGKSKNSAKGAVAAHVFENSGNYTVNLNVKDINGDIGTNQVNISIEDPNFYYGSSGYGQTICLTTSSDSSGCPSGGTVVTGASLSTIQTYLGTNKRVLLKRGDEWFFNGSIEIGYKGPWTIGSYGNCESVGGTYDEKGACSKNPKINSISNSRNIFQVYQNNLSDGRISDLIITGPYGTDTGGIVFGSTTVSNDLLVLRVNITGFDRGTDVRGRGFTTRAFFIDSDIYRNYRRGLTLGGRQNVVMGSHIGGFDTGMYGHIMRSYYSDKLNNFFIGDGRGDIKIHSALSGGPNSEFIYFGENIIKDIREYLPFQLGPQDQFQDEKIIDAVIENNFFKSSNNTQRIVSIWAQNVTIRNNIFDLSGAMGFTAIGVEQRGIEPPPKDIHIFGNSVYDNSFDISGDGLSFVYFGANVSDVVVKNNLVYSPNHVQRLITRGVCQNLIISNNLISATDPYLEVLHQDYNLKSTATEAIDNGTQIAGLFEDYSGNLRDSQPDIGAYEFISEAIPTQTNCTITKAYWRVI